MRTAGRASAHGPQGLNRVLAALLRTPLWRILGSRLAVVEYRGRRTGLSRRLPSLLIATGRAAALVTTSVLAFQRRDVRY